MKKERFFEEDFEGEDIAENTDNSPEETAETSESTDSEAEETDGRMFKTFMEYLSTGTQCYIQ